MTIITENDCSVGSARAPAAIGGWKPPYRVSPRSSMRADCHMLPARQSVSSSLRLPSSGEAGKKSPLVHVLREHGAPRGVRALDQFQPLEQTQLRGYEEVQTEAALLCFERVLRKYCIEQASAYLRSKDPSGVGGESCAMVNGSWKMVVNSRDMAVTMAVLRALFFGWITCALLRELRAKNMAVGSGST
ncbi:hypothetical protein KM043_008373 [Ampulex compressa]|nr:hypothetical protein KM043_008373 [Ampulex compressa]